MAVSDRMGRLVPGECPGGRILRARTTSARSRAAWTKQDRRRHGPGEVLLAALVECRGEDE